MAQSVAGELYESITGQLFEIGRQLRQPNGYPFDPYQLKVLLQGAIEGRFLGGQATELPVLNWHMVYEKLGMLTQFESFRTECIDAGVFAANTSTWAVPVLKGVASMKIVKAFRDLGIKVEIFGNDLDRDVPTNDRDPANGSYIVRFNKTVEADPENANQSANDRKHKSAKDITLLERLLLELGYFLTTGLHLDIENVTLCSGSRGSDGDVPRVDWYTGRRKLFVLWCPPDNRIDLLRSRAVVS